MRASRLGRWVARALVVAAIGTGVMLAGVSAASAAPAASDASSAPVLTSMIEWT